MRVRSSKPAGSTAARQVFITGTDTNVGKTVLTALLLAHLRRRGIRALAIKPCCSGGRGDVELTRALQDGELDVDEMNPFFFPEPVAPLVAARNHRRRITLHRLEQIVRRVARRCDCLLIEGAGGLLAPLAEDGSALDLIQTLGCETVVVAPNRLGMINHTLLTVRALQYPANSAGVSRRAKRDDPAHEPLRVVVIEQEHPDPSATHNPRILKELLGRVPVRRLPFLGPGIDDPSDIARLEEKHEKSIARLLA